MGMMQPIRRVAAADKHPGELLRERAYIDGRWVGQTASRVAVHDPASGVQLGTVPDLGVAETRDAVAAAHRAFADWRQRLPQERSRLLRKWYDLILAHREDLARLMTAEQGKPLHEARGEIDYAASFVEWFAEEAKRIDGEMPMSHLPDRQMTVRRVPVGVAACITPWNFPCAMVTRKARLDVKPDPRDLRDRAYIPPPRSLPQALPADADIARSLGHYTQAKLILDQGHEGACTGFGLACVINYLRWRSAGMPKRFARISPRMLYHFARRFDEYEGENYEGSSCRGARGSSRPRPART